MIQHLPMLTIVVVWLLCAVLVDPRGDFPLNDDWCYGKAVMRLLDEGKIRLVGVTTMTLIAQVVWGAAFCAVLGGTFTALRVSTLALGLIGLLVLYRLLLEVRVPLSSAAWSLV